jgi:hypothetical protein
MSEKMGRRRIATLIKLGLWVRLIVIWAGAEVFNLSPTLIRNNDGLTLITAFLGFVTMGFGIVNAFFWTLDHFGNDIWQGLVKGYYRRIFVTPGQIKESRC